MTRDAPLAFGPVASGGDAMLLAPDSRSLPLELGDHIVHLLADPDGGFWVSYGDTHLTAGGVVRYDAAGGRQWAMNKDAAEPCIPGCFHPYAMNIGSGGGRWLYYYTGFLLTRLDPAEHRFTWRPGVEFCDTVAVGNGCVMLTWSDLPSGNPHHIVLLDLTDLALPRRPRRRWIAAIDTPHGELLTARNDVLHLVADGYWHRLPIASADAQVSDGPWHAA